MLYATVVFLHSWLRWAIVIAGLAVCARGARATMAKRPWAPLDRALVVGFVSSLDAQLLLGLLLYFALSPITPHSLGDFGTFMHVAPLRFFAIEHPTAMLLAVIAAHVGWARGKRASSDATRWRPVLVGSAIAIALIFASIPWPWLSYGRPLVRGLM